MSSKIVTLVVGVLGLLLALWMGVSVAEQQWSHLFIFMAVAAGIVFVSGGYRFSFQVLLGFILIDGSFNLGFAINATEQFLIVTCALIAATFWRKEASLPEPRSLRHWSFTFVKISLGAWVGYVALHMSLHLLLFDSTGLKNILKSYNATFTPYVFLFFFFVRPRMFPIPKNYLRNYSVILFGVTGFVTAMRIYQSYFGARMLSSDPGEANMAGAMVLSAVHFVENVYALRSLAPSAMLYGVIILTTQQAVLRGFVWKFTGIFTLVLGTVAALYSGGRATIVIGVIMCLAALMLRRKRLQITLGLFSAVMVIVIANIFSGWVNSSAPMQVSRTLQWVLVEKNHQIERTIEGSSDWRWNLAKYAIKQWKESTKTIILGIGFQGISSSDLAVVGFAGSSYGSVSEEFAWDMGVKRVATHNLFTDLLVGYGVIGAVLYYLLLYGLMALSWHIYFYLPNDSPHKDFAMLTAGVAWSAAILGNISGSFLPVSVILYLIILICALFQHQANAELKIDRVPGTLTPDQLRPSDSSPA